MKYQRDPEARNVMSFLEEYFLQLGANCVITSRKLDVLQKTAAELEAETGGKCLALQCDDRL